jgi:hypothetical protein
MAKRDTTAKKPRGHNPLGRICHWLYCVKCGLLYLRNEVTQLAINASCPGDDE